jgi:uncharacterized membrane protein
MIAHVITVYLDFLGIMTLMATLLAEHVTLQPHMTRVYIQRLATIDLLSGIAAGIVLLTGLLRFAYFGKGVHFYLGIRCFTSKSGCSCWLPSSHCTPRCGLLRGGKCSNKVVFPNWSHSPLRGSALRYA